MQLCSLSAARKETGAALCLNVHRGSTRAPVVYLKWLTHLDPRRQSLHLSSLQPVRIAGKQVVTRLGGLTTGRLAHVYTYLHTSTMSTPGTPKTSDSRGSIIRGVVIGVALAATVALVLSASQGSMQAVLLRGRLSGSTVSLHAGLEGVNATLHQVLKQQQAAGEWRQATSTAVKALQEGASAMQQQLSALEGGQQAGKAALKELKAKVEANQQAASKDGLQQKVDQLAGQLAELRRAMPPPTADSSGQETPAAPKQDPTLAAVQSTFEQIYEHLVWGADGGGSGTGSTVVNTVNARATIKAVIEEYGLNSLLDVPCGAMAWMPLLLQELEASRPGFRYMGLDIARSVIEGNQKRFGDGATNWTFAVHNLADLSTPQPEGYDLLHTRDALQHLACPLVVDCLRNIAQSSIKFALIGSYDGNDNRHIQTGDVFMINLREPPYSLAPMAVFREGKIPDILDPEKLLLLYNVSSLAGRDWEGMKRGCGEMRG